MSKLPRKQPKIQPTIVESPQEKQPLKDSTSAKGVLPHLWEKLSCFSCSSNEDDKTTFYCAICLATCYKSVAYGTKKCDHQVCKDCLRQYFTSALIDARYDAYQTIECPGPDCKKRFITTNTLLEGFFNKAEMEQWWTNALIKTYITNQVRCPMDKCGAIFDADEAFTKKCTFTECYECHRGFCIACQAPWHPGEIKLFNDKKEIEKTLKHAEKNSWCRCPNCALIVEKKAGCLHMTCRCKTKFCYRCGRVDSQCRDKCANFTARQLNTLRDTMFVEKKTP